MAVDYSRIHRLLKILTLIQGSDGWNAKQLAGECGTTERTIYRDLMMIQGAGIPYFFDEEKKSYRIRRDFFMPPVQLTLDESLALTALAEHVGRTEQIPFMSAAAKAIAKIRGQLPVAIRDEVEKISAHVAIQLAAANPPEQSADVYSRMQKALSTKTALLCEYDSINAGNEKPNGQFLLLPYALFFATRAWYVLGHHGGRNEVRCLKLNRFTRVTPTTQSYRIPRSFSLDGHIGNAWRMIRGKGSHDIELHFDAEFAETIADTHWHKTQQIEWQDDGSITFKCKVDGLDEIIWWILSMGPHCVVKSPAVLRDRVRELARELLSKYESADTKSAKKPAKKPAKSNR